MGCLGSLTAILAPLPSHRAGSGVTDGNVVQVTEKQTLTFSQQLEEIFDVDELLNVNPGALSAVEVRNETAAVVLACLVQASSTHPYTC
jgi:hypothetical protein